MALSKAEQRAIEAADAERRLLREIAELQEIATRSVDPYHWSRSITGAPSNKNRTYRASDDCWNRGMKGRTYGVAAQLDHTGELNGVTTPNTVTVMKDGNVTVRSASEFRAAKIATKARAHRTAQAVSRDIALQAAMGSIHPTN